MADATSTTGINALDALLQNALAGAQPTSYGSGVETSGIDDESIGGNDFETYKAEKGRKDRITLLEPGKIVHGRSHYVEGSGFLICMSEYKKQGNTEVLVKLAPCCQRLERSKKRCSALVLQYATDRNGVPTRPVGLSYKVWRFNEKTFALLRQVNSEFPLKQHDILVTCLTDNDQKYQSVNITPCKEQVASLPAFVEKYGAEVSQFVVAMQPQLERSIGRRLSNEDWAKVLKTATPGGNSSNNAASSVADEGDAPASLDDLLNGV